MFALAASVIFLQQPRLSDVSFLHPETSATTAASVMFSQPSRSSHVSSLYPEASATTALSVIPVKPRSSDSSRGHPEATASTDPSVIFLQLFRLSDESSLHPEASATTASSVIFLQLFRLSDESWGHPEATAATAASSTVRYQSLRSARSRIARAVRAAARKDLLKCALETRSPRGFPSVCQDQQDIERELCEDQRDIDPGVLAKATDSGARPALFGRVGHWGVVGGGRAGRERRQRALPLAKGQYKDARHGERMQTKASSHVSVGRLQSKFGMDDRRGDRAPSPRTETKSTGHCRARVHPSTPGNWSRVWPCLCVASTYENANSRLVSDACQLTRAVWSRRVASHTGIPFATLATSPSPLPASFEPRLPRV